jgi:hypothetical protein
VAAVRAAAVRVRVTAVEKVVQEVAAAARAARGARGARAARAAAPRKLRLCHRRLG